MSVAWTTRPTLERARESVALEALEARPQADVRIRRVLILDAADPLERTRDREARPLEQELAREQRPVQLALREDTFRHRANVLDGRARDAPCAVAMPPTTRAPPSASHR